MERKSKKLILVMFTLMVVLGLLMAMPLVASAATGSLVIGGVEVVFDLTADSSGTGWTWASASSTLTLTSTYTGKDIYIDCAATDTINLVFSGNITVENTSELVAIRCEGNLNITGSSGKVDIISDDGYGIVSIGNVTIGGSTEITVVSSYTGICSYGGGITINGDANVTISSADYGIAAELNGGVTISDNAKVMIVADSDGIKSSRYVTISGSADVDIDSIGTGIYSSGSGDITISSGTVNITSDLSIGIHAALNNVTISGGIVDIDSGLLGIFATRNVTINGNPEITIHTVVNGGINAVDSVTISGGKINITSDDSFGILASRDITISGGSEIIIVSARHGIHSFNQSVIISGSWVNIISNGGGANGIAANHSITISDVANITIVAGYYGLYATQGNINLIGSGAVMVTGFEGLFRPPNGIMVSDNITLTITNNSLYAKTYRFQKSVSTSTKMWKLTNATTTASLYGAEIDVTLAAGDTGKVERVASNNATLNSVLRQTITAGSEKGSDTDPITANISVANSVSSIANTNLTAAAGASASLYSDGTFTTPISSVSLDIGANHIYIKVTAEDSVTELYYSIAVTRQTVGSVTGGGGGGTPNASVSPSTADYDASSGGDITITLNLNNFTLKDIKNGSYTLKEGTDYTVSGNKVTIRASYLSGLSTGAQQLVFNMSGGNNPKLTITVKDGTSVGQPEPSKPEPMKPNHPAGTWVNATKTNNPLFLNGEEVDFPAVKIDGWNRLKLRDVAMLLKGTSKQFSVGYDEATKTITITTGKVYEPVGDELQDLLTGNPSAMASLQTIIWDGKVVDVAAYNIKGYNYFRLRDLMILLDIYVDYNEATGDIALDLTKAYTE